MKRLGMAVMGILLSCYVHGQFAIKGKVKGENGETLPGASLTIKTTGVGTITDLDGNYSINNLSEGSYLLQVGFVGFLTQEKEVFVSKNVTLDFVLEESVFQGDEVIVYATRANENTPTTFSEVSKEEIASRNLGQDMPYILRFVPSMVTTSDAGAGVGYTGMRIRGSDATRINVTVNGIPINDSESHGTFWVNMPDFASSVNNIQVQRGVGTSTNGAAAFGATISMQTSVPSQKAYSQIDNSFGSFGTRKHTAIFNSGLIKDRWSFEGRLSQIASDGYIDRASSDLKSYYLAGGYYGDKTTIKALTFAGKEVTYQSWYGTPEAKLNGGAEDISDLINWGGEYGTQEQLDNLNNSGRRFNYYTYDNEVDNYQQDHYQLHLNHTVSSEFNVSLSGHYTYGRGYFEQFRNDDDFGDYGLSNVSLGDTTIESTNLIRRRWLENHFYGFTFAANYQSGALSTSLGGGYNFYDGDHFGEIIWSQYASDSQIRDRYYDNFGRKGDFNIYSKTNFQATSNLNLFLDIQYRTIDYRTKGIDSDRRPIDIDDNFHFLNPKVGLTYTLNKNSNVYASYAIGNREPVRGDFVDALEGQTPKHETLKNLEIGYRKTTSNYSVSVNYFLMNYDNQLVLTGELNDVGSGLRTNVDKSYRTGIEIVGGVKLFEVLEWSGNASLSQNKIKNFGEIAYDYGVNFDEFNVVTTDHKDTDIAFSPNVILGSQLSLSPVKGFSVELLSKYVGKQFLDNTSNDDRAIDSYFINDLKLDYVFSPGFMENVAISLLINNVFDVKYSSNGYTWGYYSGDFLYQQNNYYPQAGTNLLAGLSLKF
ncbi:MAG: TonB-dependent receptor [Cyclobacteriaceae bacterium]